MHRQRNLVTFLRLDFIYRLAPDRDVIKRGKILKSCTTLKGEASASADLFRFNNLIQIDLEGDKRMRLLFRTKKGNQTSNVFKANRYRAFRR